MSIHGRFGVAVIVVSVVGVVLVLLARARPANIPTVRVFVRLCAAAAAVEALIGIILVIAGHRPTETHPLLLRRGDGDPDPGRGAAGAPRASPRRR